MTKVNWEREPGETVEEFVEALILTTVNRRAVRITPSRGDKGVDILAPVGDQFDVYQVKRYTRPFGKSSSEENSIVDSWNRFVEEFLPAYPIRRWNLVMPWNPTTERHDWLINTITSGVDIERDWLGRGTLDVWSAQNPALVEYFFGNGRDRMMDLLASALNGAQQVPEISGEPLLDAVLAREKELAKQLDQVDPFYSYEVAVRNGKLTESILDQAPLIDPKAALVTFRELEGNQYQQISIYPKCRESARLRPISTTFTLDTTADHETLRAAHDMLAYGTQPDRPIPVNITRSEGPPGVEASDGPALMYVMNMDQPTRPDLELRLNDARLSFTNIVVSRGFNGVQVSGDAEGGVFKVAIIFHNGGRSREIIVETTHIGGKLPHSVIPGLEFLQHWTNGAPATLAIPYGKELLDFGPLPNAQSFHEQSSTWLEIAKNIVRLQSVSSEQLLMPNELTSGEAEKIAEAVRLLDGEVLESEWTGFEFEIRRPENLNATTESDTNFQFLTFLPFFIEYDDVRHQLDGVVAHWGAGQFADPSVARSASPGDAVAVVPVPGHKLRRQYGRSGPSAAEPEPVNQGDSTQAASELDN
ncbi:hypothetical protein [Mycobacterium marinum]|uniref:hypothetical protein n=1 Tax=Mycobacterium marinum TaxID=1781 RepID=UPI0019220540|nr:hypothetical protein [Mycobacterium marinum]QQW36303.1 hypothetical protein HXW97_22565 [Mycobacterium marinum]